MIKYFCDRCGNDCSESHSLIKISEHMWNGHSISYDGSPESYKLNLCPNCFTQFNRFIEKKKILDVD